MAEPFRQNELTGGVTDRFRDGNPKFARTVENMVPSENRRLESRWGFERKYATDTSPFGLQRIQRTFKMRQRSTNTDYIQFGQSNGVLLGRKNNTGIWFAAECGVHSLDFDNQQNSQDKWVRINDSELVFMQTEGTHPIHVYNDGTDWRYASLGLPVRDKDASLIQPTAANAGATYSYVYAMVLRWEYQIIDPSLGVIDKVVFGGVTFTKFVTTLYPIGGAGAPTNTTVSFTPQQFDATKLSFFTDNVGETVTDACFDYANITYSIYRTEDGGTIFREVEPNFVTDGTTFIDSSTDADIQSGALLYVEGGVIENAMPNKYSQFSTYANDTLWFGSTSQIWQAKSGIFGAAPGSFISAPREGEEIVGMDMVDIYPIVFTDVGAYRVEGIIDDLGRGTNTFRTIAETDGAVSQSTIVKADEHIYFLGSDGMYFTNGYKTKKVSNHWNKTYKSIFKDKETIRKSRGVWDDCHRRVYWFYPSADVEWCDSYVMIDLKYPHEEGMPIFTGKTTAKVTDAFASAGGLTVVTDTGHVLEQFEDTTYDVDTVNDDSELTGGLKQAIEWTYTTCTLSFGSSLMIKWFTRLLLHFTNKSDITFKVQSETDESDDWRDHNAVRERGKTSGLYFLKRWFPKGKLRGTYKSLRFTNADKQVLFRSDDTSLCAVVGANAVINTGTWPAAVYANYVISFGTDDYAAEYRINADASGDTLSLDSAPTATTNEPWQIKGVPTDEKVEMNGYTVEYHTPGEGHTQSQPTAEGNT